MDYPIPECRDPQRSHFAVGLGNVDPFDRLRTIGAVQQFFAELLNQCLSAPWLSVNPSFGYAIQSGSTAASVAEDVLQPGADVGAQPAGLGDQPAQRGGGLVVPELGQDQRVLLAAEVAAVEQRRLQGRLRFAKLPARKTLEQFDFSAQSNLDRRVVEDLATLRFIEDRANVLMIGPPGVGKTMLATILGHEMTHVTHRHALKFTRDARNKQILYTVLGIAASTGRPDGTRAAASTAAAVTTARTTFFINDPPEPRDLVRPHDNCQRGLSRKCTGGVRSVCWRGHACTVGTGTRTGTPGEGASRWSGH